MPESRMDTLARKVLDARSKYDKARKEKADAEQRKKDAEDALHQELVAQKMPTVTLELGEGYGTYQFGKRSTIRSRVIDKDLAIKAFEQDGLSDGYTVTELRKAPVNELVRERLENGQELPDGIDWSETKYVQVTKR